MFVFMFYILQLMFAMSQGSCYETFNETKGEITTPGFPDQLKLNASDQCTFKISVNDGRIKLIFENVSLPNKTFVVVGLRGFFIGSHELEGRIIYSDMSHISIFVVLPQNVSITQDYKGLQILYERISSDVCRYTYQTNIGLASSIVSPGWPRSYESNKTCEYFIESGGVERVMIGFRQFFLSPADVMTFYDGSDDSILARINGTPSIIKSVTSNSASIRVVFHSKVSESPFALRRYYINHQAIARDACVEQYYGESGRLSSANKTCLFIVQIPEGKIELKFENLFVPPNDNIIVTQKSPMYPTSNITKVWYIMPSQSGQVNYITSNRDEDTLEVKFNSSSNFNLTFQEFKIVICKEEYSGAPGNLSSANKSCIYVIKMPARRIELKFEDLFIPPNDRIIVTQNSLNISYLIPSDSGRVQYIISDNIGDTLEIKFNSSAKFHLTFKEYKVVYSINLRGSRGILTSPHYPQGYPNDNKLLTYYVQVPDGHVELNFTELSLSPMKSGFYQQDNIRVYNGVNSSGQLLAILRNKTVRRLPVISSNNSMTVVFTSYLTNQEKGTFRFKAIFTRKTQVTYCKPLNMSNGNTYANRELTIPGWWTKYYCKADYVNRASPYDHSRVIRICGIGGNWIPGKVLDCIRRCPHLNESLKVNSSLTWIPSSTRYPIYDGLSLFFFCSSSPESDMIGPSRITCTSYGNYSASPPTCKKRPVKKVKDDSSSGIKPWVYGVGVGGLIAILGIVVAVLQVFLGCFSRHNTNGNDNMELGQVNFKH